MMVIAAVLISAPFAHAQTAAKRDTTKAATKAPVTTKAATKAPVTTKPATGAKPATTTTKPATTIAKPATTTAKPADAKASDAKPASPKPASTSTRPASTSAAARTARTAPAPIGKPTPFDEGGAALYAGMAMPSLSFGAGPSGGLAVRKPFLAAPLTLRADVAGSYHTQPTTVSGVKAATLIHAGASAGLELTLRGGTGMRPYVGGAVGVYRFQASGAAGKAAINAGDVFASTTDVAGIATLGLRLNSRLFVEGRYITVGDFTSMPIGVGVRF
jgi:hypothetical protein